MKKSIILLVISLCLFITACDNQFAKEDYNSVEKIAQKEDHYAKESSIFNPIEGGYSLIVSKFDGYETLWSDKVAEEQEMEIDFSFSLSEGQAKIVHIDGDGNVTTVIECSPESCTDELVTKTVLLKSGKNRLRIVGYDCEDIDLEMLFEFNKGQNLNSNS